MKYANYLFTVILIALLAACASTPMPSSPPVPGSERKLPSHTPNTENTPAPLTQESTSNTKKGGGYYKDDGPEDNPPTNLADVPDAQPKLEPLHPFANKPYVALGQNYEPQADIKTYNKNGRASWYGRRFKGKKTSSGEPYDMYAMTAAHPTLPIPSYVKVTNLTNGKSVVVRVNDRGPFHADRIIDLSYAAAYKLDYIDKGTARVNVELIVPEENALQIAQSGKSSKATIAATKTQPVVENPVNTQIAQVDAPPPQTAITTATSNDALHIPPPSLPGVAEASNSTPALAVTDKSNDSKNIFLQLGVFSSAINAENFKSFVQHEIQALTDRLTILESQGKFRLNTGPFTSMEEARRLADKIASKLKFKPFVVMR